MQWLYHSGQLGTGHDSFVLDTLSSFVNYKESDEIWAVGTLPWKQRAHVGPEFYSKPK